MDINQIIHEYNSGRTPQEISTVANMNATKIRRMLIAAGVPMRSKSESQKLALSRGNATHPTKGKTLSNDTRTKISNKRSEAWQGMTPEDREKVSACKRDQWKNMSDEAKANLQSLAHVAIRESAVLGSKTERFLESSLEKCGFRVELHPKHVIKDENLELDLFLPEFNTAIEIDGPTHFLPIYGEEKLRKQKEADLRKEGQLLAAGYVIIRIRMLDSETSQKRMRDINVIILNELDKIKDSFPPEGKRLIEIEISNGVSRKL